jgi:hypothetical protein
MKSLLAGHPLAQHGGLIFLGQILLVLVVPLVDRGEQHTPMEMFLAAIAATSRAGSTSSGSASRR